MSNNVMSDNGVISNTDGVVHGREKVRYGPMQTVIQRPHQVCKICKLRVSSWNVGTMHGTANEVVETLGHKCIDICCIQESCWKGCSGYSTRLISAKILNISSYGAETTQVLEVLVFCLMKTGLIK